MKIEKLFFSVLVALLLIPVSGMAEKNEKKVKIEKSPVISMGRTSVPSVDATQYSDYILLDINRYYGNVVVEVENEETGETVYIG